MAPTRPSDSARELIRHANLRPGALVCDPHGELGIDGYATVLRCSPNRKPAQYFEAIWSDDPSLVTKLRLGGHLCHHRRPWTPELRRAYIERGLQPVERAGLLLAVRVA